MSVEKLVLYRSRREKIFVAVVLAVVILPLGPVLRYVLGDHYSSDIGFAAFLGVMLLTSWIATRIAKRRGGEWITRIENLKRLQEEASNSSPLAMSVTCALCSALGLFTFFLTQEPLDRLDQAMGSTTGLILALAMSAAFCGTLNFFGHRNLRLGTIEDSEPPPSANKILTKGLAQYLLAFLGLSIVAAVSALWLADESWRGTVYFASAGILFLVLVAVSLWRAGPTTFYTRGEPKPAQFVAIGFLYYGVPLSLLLSGMAVVMTWGSGTGALFCCLECVMYYALPAGALLGLFFYANYRLGTPRRDVAVSD